ncbi:MAG: hypothetical protein K9G62_01735 [Alphaproteobacteria bacterium]|nr:hypothetical protein [Alphaproteobacteria bacterium]
MISRLPIIGVMGSHEQEWTEFSEPLGRLIAEQGYHLLTGAGAGVMTAVAGAYTAVKKRAGVSIGIVPTVDYEGHYSPGDEYPNPYIEIPILTPLDKKMQSDSMPYSRNYVNIMTSNAVVILPGEHGTKNEAALSIMFKKPMIMFGPEAAFTSFPEHAERAQAIEQVAAFLERIAVKIGTSEN